MEAAVPWSHWLSILRHWVSFRRPTRTPYSSAENTSKILSSSAIVPILFRTSELATDISLWDLLSPPKVSNTMNLRRRLVYDRIKRVHVWAMQCFYRDYRTFRISTPILYCHGHISYHGMLSRPRTGNGERTGNQCDLERQESHRNRDTPTHQKTWRR